MDIPVGVLQEPRLVRTRHRASEAHPSAHIVPIDNLLEPRDTVVVVVAVDTECRSIRLGPPRDGGNQCVEAFVCRIDPSDPSQVPTATCPSLARYIEAGRHGD